MIKTEIGEDIIQMYKPYKDKTTKWAKTIVNNEPVEVYARYQVKQLLGKGAYGIVVAATDKQAKTEEKRLVAIKKINKAFEHKIFARRTLRQLKLLKMLKHQNIIGIQTILQPRSRQDFEDMSYIVFELMYTDLHTIIKNKHEELPPERYKFLLYQMLRGLKYIHSAKIVHRDLKPRNLLINSSGDLKICDFGLGRYIEHKPKSYVLTDYVTTRWYRAPELLLGCKTYETSVDIWSVGCIMAEMILRKPFLPGSDTREQIQMICQALGPPDLEDMKDIPHRSIQIVKLCSKRKKKARDFKDIFLKAPPQAVDLLKKMLIFDPSKRISVYEALKHPFFSDLHWEEDQPVCGGIDTEEFDFEDHNLTTQQLKDMLYQETLLYNNQQFRAEFEKKKKNKQSLIAHILKNSNATNINPVTDEDDQQEDDIQ